MKLIIIFLSLFSAGCAILQSTSLTEVDTSTVDHPVVFSESSSFGLLHLELATEYSRYNITKTLASECVGGKISNVETISAMKEFFGIVQTYYVYSSANCTNANK